MILLDVWGGIAAEHMMVKIFCCPDVFIQIKQQIVLHLLTLILMLII